MWLNLVLTLILSSACTLVAPHRNIASENLLHLGILEPAKSRVMFYPPDAHNPGQKFYLELRNDKNALVDVDNSEIVVTNNNQAQAYNVKRLSQGRFEIFATKKISDLKKLKFTVQGKILPHKLMTLGIPAKNTSVVSLIEVSEHTLKMKMVLKDKKGNAVETRDEPEVIVEGMGDVSELQMIQNGVWEFKVSFPEENQIMYLTIRANEVSLDRVFRYQHVEK